MNLHLSEVVSDILEPLVGTIEEGVEVISGEDMLARVDRMNEKFEGWTKHSWWEGKTSGNYVACGTCGGKDGILDERVEQNLCTCGRLDEPSPGKIRTTAKYVKLLRRREWEHVVGWDDNDLDRKYSSKEMLQEDCQDYTTPMVLVGSDVVSLYPNLDVSRVSRLMYEAVKTSPLKWDNVDWLECCRYVALNWTRQQCRLRKLRRVLPTRRYTKGTKPGLRGSGPRGKERGDTEH